MLGSLRSPFLPAAVIFFTACPLLPPSSPSFYLQLVALPRNPGFLTPRVFWLFFHSVITSSSSFPIGFSPSPTLPPKPPWCPHLPIRSSCPRSPWRLFFFFRFQRLDIVTSLCTPFARFPDSAQWFNYPNHPQRPSPCFPFLIPCSLTYLIHFLLLQSTLSNHQLYFPP